MTGVLWQGDPQRLGQKDGAGAGRKREEGGRGGELDGVGAVVGDGQAAGLRSRPERRGCRGKSKKGGSGRSVASRRLAESVFMLTPHLRTYTLR